jgi:REP element-mobilizing transposase RayT
VQYEGARYHIINRGNYRKDLFLTHKTDQAFTEVMLEACERYHWTLHAYVLMNNHYHLCVETPNANLSDGMHWLQSTFANKFSRFSGERGHVFQGRYKSLIIEREFGLLNVVDYIHLNPVRAGVLPVSQLKEYSNSSFPRYFTKYRHRSLRCEDFLAEAGGLSPTPGGMRSYHKRLKLIMEDSPQERERLFKDLSRGWYIGSKQGKDQLSTKVEQGTAKASVDAKFELESIRTEKLLKACLKRLGKNQKDIEGDNKSAQWKLAIASLVKTSTGIKNPQLCAYLNLGHPATMSKLVGIYNHTEKDNCPYGKQLKTLNN